MGKYAAVDYRENYGCGDLPIDIRPLAGRADLTTFLNLPQQFYHKDPHWIEPLRLERRQHLSKHNPLFEHLDWQGWLAWRGSQPVGRITAQLDHLHQQRYGDGTGYFGMLEAADDPAVFAALTASAEEWLRRRGARRVIGPFNLSINDECGLLVEGFDRPPMFMMGHARPYYAQRLEEQGYNAAKDLLAYWMSVADLRFTPFMRRLMAHCQDRIHVRPISRERFAADLEILREIFNDAWSENWGFVPFTQSEFHELGRNLRLFVAYDLIQIAEVDGAPAAFIVALPNINEAIRGLRGRLLPFGWMRLLWRLKVRYPLTGRIPLMGVCKRHQFSRLGPALALTLIAAIQKRMMAKGIQAVEMSWILEDNAGMRNILENIGTELYKRYRLYQKPLAETGAVERA
ncbi:MAG TPA: N-acetyltransferase [Nitrococcus sp.]|nr:N-acetyltransferase [Nitrococcus sp.]